MRGLLAEYPEVAGTLARLSICALFAVDVGCNRASSAPIVSESHIVFRDRYIDIGQLVCGTELEKELPFTVEGGSPIRIVEVIASCGCATPTIQQCGSEGDGQRRPFSIGDEMQPGTSGVVLVRMHTANELGRKDIHISIRTEMPSEVASTFMAVKILPAFDVIPDTIALGNVLRDQGGGSSVLLQGVEGHPVRVRDLVVDDTRLEVTIDNSSESVAVLGIRVQPGCAVGRIQSRVRVVMEQGQAVDIPVEGTVLAE